MKPGAIVEKAREICLSYKDQGLTLTVRQLYYQFVSLGLLPNGQEVYKRIVNAMSEARVEGRFPMDLIEDRGRDAQAGECTRSDDNVDVALGRCEHHLKAFPSQYLDRDRWFGQPVYVSVWVEKEALAGVFDQALRDLGVGLFACRGYPSVSSLYQYLQNLDRATGGETEDDQYGQHHSGRADRAVVLYFGDHDPDGLQIPISAEQTMLEMVKNIDELEDLRERDVFPHFERIALTHSQILQHNPPPFPAKETSSRFASYVARTGLRDAWELDALNPTILRQLIRDSVERHFDQHIHDLNETHLQGLRAVLKQRMLKPNWLKKALPL